MYRRRSTNQGKKQRSKSQGANGGRSSSFRRAMGYVSSLKPTKPMSVPFRKKAPSPKDDGDELYLSGQNHHGMSQPHAVASRFDRTSQYSEQSCGNAASQARYHPEPAGETAIAPKDSHFSRAAANNGMGVPPGDAPRQNGYSMPGAYNTHQRDPTSFNSIPLGRTDSYGSLISTGSSSSFAHEDRDPPPHSYGHADQRRPISAPIPFTRSRSHGAFTTSTSFDSQESSGSYMPNDYGVQNQPRVFNDPGSFDAPSWLSDASGATDFSSTESSVGYQLRRTNTMPTSMTDDEASVTDLSCADLSTGYELQRNNTMPDGTDGTDDDLAELKRERKTKKGGRILGFSRSQTVGEQEEASRQRAAAMFTQYEQSDFKSDELNKRAHFKSKGKEHKSAPLLNTVKRKQKIEAFIQKKEFTAQKKAQKIMDHPFLTEEEKQKHFKKNLKKFKRGDSMRKKKGESGKQDRNLSDLTADEEGIVIYGAETIEVVPEAPRKSFSVSTLGSLVRSKSKRSSDPTQQEQSHMNNGMGVELL